MYCFVFVYIVSYSNFHLNGSEILDFLSIIKSENTDCPKNTGFEIRYFQRDCRRNIVFAVKMYSRICNVFIQTYLL